MSDLQRFKDHHQEVADADIGDIDKALAYLHKQMELRDKQQAEIERLQAERDEAREAARYLAQFTDVWDSDKSRWPWLEGDDGGEL